MPTLGPRIVVAGTSSGVGKTTVAAGLMAALAAKGARVAGAKVGPDFIDPGYHGLATGRPGRNLDSWMCGAGAIGPLASRAAHGADLLVIEGVMGLFDGAALELAGAGKLTGDTELDGAATVAGRAELARSSGDARGAEASTTAHAHLSVASTAHVAALLEAPIVLVVDASAMSASVAAVVHGFATYHPSIRIAGVILNRVGSDSHEVMLRHALEPSGIPVLGALRRDPSLVWRDRHLGLVPVAEQPDTIRASLDRLAQAISSSCDLEAVEAIARAAPRLHVPAPAQPRVAGRAAIAIAAGPAFAFVYRDNVEMLEVAGAELVPFDPRVDPALPGDCTALYAPGGFPEVFAADLAENRPLLDDVAERVRTGLVVWAECGGMLWLARSLDGHALTGVLPADATMTERLTMGYRIVRTRAATPIGPEGTALHGHEFHYSQVDPAGDALDLTGREGASRAGFASARLLASYLHLHLGAHPAAAEAFVAAAARSPSGQAPH